MSGIFGPRTLPTVPIPPQAPQLSDAEVQRAASDEQRRRSASTGRASTYLTNPAMQRTAEANQQRYLGGL